MGLRSASSAINVSIGFPVKRLTEEPEPLLQLLKPLFIFSQ